MSIVTLLTDSGKDIVRAGFPAASANLEERGIPGDFLGDMFYRITGVDIREPKTFLGSAMNIFDIAMAEENYIAYESVGLLEEEIEHYSLLYEEDEEVEVVESEEEEVELLSEDPLVGIYNTHNSETYIPTDGEALLPGENAGVVKVAKNIAGILEEKHGIKSVHSAVIHDYPDWEQSYAKSALTANRMLEEYPSIEILLDIHRDAGIPEKSVAVFGDEIEMATILLVVGSDNRLEHPNWRKNLAFAREVGDKMDELYPGLLKEIRVQTGRYNQHLHENAILVEIGCTKNTLEEALASSEAFAHVISEILRD